MISSHISPTIGSRFFLILALILRVIWAVGAPQWDPKLRASERWGDAQSYHLLAESILRGQGLERDGQPTAFRPPVYPIFLAALYLLLGSSPLVLRCVQSLLGVLTVYLIYRLARRSHHAGGEPLQLALNRTLGEMSPPTAGEKVGMGRTEYGQEESWVGVLACGMIALHPLSIYAGGWLYGETLAVLLVTMALLASLDQRGFVQAIAGLLAAAAILTRPPIFLLLPGIIIQSLLLHPGPVRMKLLRAGLVLCSALVLLFPWTIRNKIQLGKWIPLTTSSGANLWGGNNPQSNGGFTALPAHPNQSSPYFVEGMSEVESDAFLRSAARSYVKENPVSALLKAPKKLLRLFSPVEFGTSGKLSLNLSGLLWIGQGSFLSFAFLGMAASAKQWKKWLGAWSMLLGILFSAILFFGSPRFHLPALPVLCLFAARGVTFSVERVRTLHPVRT